MNRLYFSKFLLAVAVVLGCSVNAIAQTTVTFTYPSTITRFYTVPFGASIMSVDIKGARGGYSNSAGAPASGNGNNGSGAEVLATIAVTGGQIFQINLGGSGQNSINGTTGTDNFTPYAGGTNGGGIGYGRGAGGGGASDIRNINYAVSNRIVVAAGGGGWGGVGSSSPFSAGGCGGGLTGDAGWWNANHTGSNMTQNCGQGGTQGGGGLKAGQAYNQTDGAVAQGGNAANNTATSGYGGGGGGGYYGGGGGAYGGGGGGSSYTDPVYVTASSVSLFQCANDADGSITITTDCNQPTQGAIVGPTSICSGGSTTFTNPTSSGGGTWSSSDGSMVNFPSNLSGFANIGFLSPGSAPRVITVTHKITYGCGVPTNALFTITVNPLPDPITSDGVAAPIKPICAGNTQTVFASGPGTWSASNTNIATVSNTLTGGPGSGLALITGIAAGTSVITYTLPTGCQSVATETVNPIPAPITTSSPSTVCQGTPSVTFSDASGGGVWSISNSFTPISSGGVVGTATPGAGDITYKFTATGCNVTRGFTISALPSNVVNIQIQQSSGPLRCSNGDSIELSHAYTEAGNTYCIYRNGILLNCATGDGNSLSYGKIAAAGVYSVIATSPGGCVTKMSGTATITVDPAPTALPFHLDGPASFCLDPGVGRKLVMDNTQCGKLSGMYYTVYRDGIVGEVLTHNCAVSNPSIMSSPITTGGLYTIIATDPDSGPGGCSTTQIGAYNITPLPLPQVDTLIGGGFYCLGGVGVSVCMKNSVVNVDYALYNPGLDTVHAGTGAGFCFGTNGLRKTAGTYAVTETNHTTGCQVQAYVPNPVVVGIYPNPQVDIIEGSAHICSNSTTGAMIDLQSSLTGMKYQLLKDGVATGGLVDGITGTQLPLGAQFLAGVYTAIGTDQTTHCSSPMSGTAVVVLDPIPTVYNVGGGGSFCVGSNPSSKDVTLDGSDADATYQRIRAGVPVGFPVPGDFTGANAGIDVGQDTETGLFTVKATSTVNGCSNMMAGSATVAINALPKRYAVAGGGNYCLGTGGVNINMPHSGLGVSYQLFDASGVSVSSLIAGANAGIDFGTYTTIGSYYAMGTNVTTGCMDTMSNMIDVTNTPKPLVYAVTGSASSYCSGDPGIDIMLSSSQAGVKYQFFRSGLAIGTPADGTGLTLDFGMQTIPGAYSITAADTTTGCKDTMFGKAVVVINSLPAVYIVGGGGNYCAGGAGLHITLTGSQPTVSYQLYNTGMPVGAPMPGTGAPLDFGLQTAGGNYTVMAVNPSTTCVSSMSGSVNINVRTLPMQFHVAGGGDICVGSTGTNITLSSSESDVTYRLYNNGVAIDAAIAGTTGSINFGIHSAAGTYSILGTRTATGCTNWMLDNTVVNINPLPTAYGLSGASTFCKGAPGTHITNSGSLVGVNYQLMNGSTPVGMYITGNGNALDFGVPDTSGMYTVMATDALTGCSSKTATPIKVTINPLPAVQSMTGGGGYCVVKSGAPMGLAWSDAGINYQLYRGGSTSVGGLMPGGGYPVNFGLQKIAGTYTAVAINALTGCKQDMTGTSVVSIDPITPPSVSIVTGTGMDTLCAGATYSFTAVPVNGGVTPSFAWSVNGGPAIAYGPSYTYVPVNGDILAVTLTSSADCAVPTATTTNKILTTQPFILPSATLAVDKGDAICAGTAVTFTASPLNDGYMQDYNWIKNGIVQTSEYGKLTYSYSPKDKDIVIFMLGSHYPCRLKDSVFSNTYAMVVDPGVAPVVTIIATQSTKLAPGQMDTFLAVATNVGLFPKYQWLNNGSPIPGATTSRYISNQFFDKDVLACSVTSSLPCGLTAMNATVIDIIKSTVTGQVTAAGTDIRVMPNPSKGEFTVKGTLGMHVDGDVSMEITNMLGQAVYSKTVVASNGTINERIQLGNVAAGMYLLNVRSGAGSNVYHIVIEQ